jgi:hypothetical protein
VGLIALSVLPARAGAPGAALSSGYFSLQPDPRLCPSPICGGFFVGLLNLPVAHCSDGEDRRLCHASTVDWSALGLDAETVAQLQAAAVGGRVIVRGELRSGTVLPGFPPSGELVASEAWIAASGHYPRGGFFQVARRGIVCGVSPCSRFTEVLLNSNLRGELSDLDLSHAGADPVTQQLALDELERGSILVAGRNRVGAAANRRGPVTLLATQFYLKVAAARP